MIRIERKITTMTKIATTATRIRTRIWPTLAPMSPIEGFPFICSAGDGRCRHHFDGGAEDGRNDDAVAHVEGCSRLRGGQARRPRFAVVELHRTGAVDETGDDTASLPVDGVDVGFESRIAAVQAPQQHGLDREEQQ